MKIPAGRLTPFVFLIFISVISSYLDLFSFRYVFFLLPRRFSPSSLRSVQGREETEISGLFHLPWFPMEEYSCLESADKR